MTEYQDMLSWLVVLWGGVLVLGGVVSYYALRAWRSSRERTFAFLTAGFVAIGLASPIAWFGLYLMGQNIIVCESGATGFLLGGFGTILYAVRTR